ncbi:MAG: hypothetical protein RAP70_00055 [Candidatus Celaenobacter antarcticus]|nr:hypothetical protein [Candidatus Celaenobacter antarcticus]
MILCCLIKEKAKNNLGIINNLVDYIENRPEIKRNQYTSLELHDFITPEIHTIEKELLFSAGWALELLLLCDVYDKDSTLKGEIKVDGIRKFARKIIGQAIDDLLKPSESMKFHLYSMTQRFWFFLEYWQYKAISAANKLMNLDETSFDKEYKPVKDKGLFHYYNSLWSRIFGKDNIGGITHLPDKKKVMNNKKLPGTKYSCFIMGGSGIGKTGLVEKVLREEYSLKGAMRITPMDLKIFGCYYLLKKITKSNNIIVFLDEIHINTGISPYAFMLDPLQDDFKYEVIEELEEKKGGNKKEKDKTENNEEKDKKILYIFASSAYKTKDEFKRKAIESNDIAMYDFATRIGHWVVLPDLFQMPEQKHILGYFIGKKTKYNFNYKQLQSIAALITINASLKSSREIEYEINRIDSFENINEEINKWEEEIKKRYLRGTIENLFPRIKHTE